MDRATLSQCQKVTYIMIADTPRHTRVCDCVSADRAVIRIIRYIEISTDGAG